MVSNIRQAVPSSSGPGGCSVVSALTVRAAAKAARELGRAEAAAGSGSAEAAAMAARALASAQGLTLVHFFAQPKPFWSHLPVSPCLIDWGIIMPLTYPTKRAYVEPESGRVCKPLPPPRLATRRWRRCGAWTPPPPPRGLHSSTFRLNLSALYGIGGARRACVARVESALGGVRGCQGVFRVCRVFVSDTAQVELRGGRV